MEKAGLEVNKENPLDIHGYVPKEMLTTTDAANVRVRISQGGEIWSVHYDIEDRTLEDIDASIEEYRHLLEMLNNGLKGIDTDDKILTANYTIPDELISVMKENKLKKTSESYRLARRERLREKGPAKEAKVSFFHYNEQEANNDTIPERGVLTLDITW